jgi:hypothetical protein
MKKNKYLFVKAYENKVGKCSAKRGTDEHRAYWHEYFTFAEKRATNPKIKFYSLSLIGVEISLQRTDLSDEDRDSLVKTYETLKASECNEGVMWN